MTTMESREAIAPVEPRPAHPGSGEAPRPAAPVRARRLRLSTWAVVLVALCPFVVGAWSILERGFPEGALFGDRALVALSASDAFRAPVLLGPYSRFYWHHPGPLYFYVLNGWSTVFGQGTVSFVLGATAINVAASGGILVLAFRRGGRALLVWAALLLTTYLVAIDPIPFDIWNPSVTLIPFVVVLLLAWSIACRDWWATPWLVLVASFAVQTHVGLAPGVGVAIAFAVAVGFWRVRRSGPLASEERRTIRRAALTSGVVGVIVWLPPVIEQLTSREGNLTALVRFFTQPGNPHTVSEGIEHTALQATLMLRGVFEPVSLRGDLHQGLTIAIVISVVAAVVAVVAARVARSTDTLLLLALVALELLAGVYAVTRIVDAIQFYLVQWISAVGFVLWLAIGSAVVDLVRARWSQPSWHPTLVRTATLVVVAVLCVSAVRAVPGDAGAVNENLNVPNDRALFGYVPAKALLRATRPGRTVVLRLDSVTAWEVMASDALLLAQHGRTVEVVETPETRLLFDDALLVPKATGGQVLDFRDRKRVEVGADETLVAHHGAWTIVERGDG